MCVCAGAGMYWWVVVSLYVYDLLCVDWRSGSECVCINSVWSVYMFRIDNVCMCVYTYMYICVCLCVSVSMSNVYIGMEWTEYMYRIDWVIPSGCAKHTVHVCIHTCMYACVFVCVRGDIVCVSVCLFMEWTVYICMIDYACTCVCIRVRCVYIRYGMCECA